jgi:hypothetical protein
MQPTRIRSLAAAFATWPAASVPTAADVKPAD